MQETQMLWQPQEAAQSSREHREKSGSSWELSEIQLLAVVAQHSAFRVGSQPHSSVVTKVIC